jgi:capsular exopolysaccharide synthesis family protein
LASVLDQFNERLTVEPIRNTQLVRVHFEAKDPALAADVANNLADAYIEQHLEQRLAVTQKASSFLSERLEGLRQTVAAAEQRLQDFLDQEELVDVQGVTSLNAQQLDELNSQLVEASRARAEAEAIFRQVEPLKGRPVDELLAFPAILNHETVQPVMEVADEIDQEVAELSKRYGRRHPEMIAVMSRYDTAQANLERQVRQVIGTIENQYLAAVANEDAARARLAASRAEMQSINRKSFTLQELERDVETNRQLYDMFFTRVRETDETNDFEAANALVVDPAVAAINPSKPRRSLIVMIAFAVALMLGVLLAFLRDMLDNTVKTPEDVENRLNATMLGLITLQPLSRAEKKKHLALVGDKDHVDAGFIESLRTIRTGLTLSSLDNPYKLIEVTSSIPNEGKSTVSLNLATMMGQMGKALLIDADLRRPSLARSINLPPNNPGVTNVLAGTASLKEAIVHDKALGIDMLTSGQHSSNPLELIASNKFKELLKKLGEHYDYIILDTPPTQAVSDALVMGSIADAVVYVVKAHSTSINTVKHGLNRLQYANANVVGVVLNQVDTKKQSYYGGNDYYAGYYDSYGYSKT